MIQLCLRRKMIACSRKEAFADAMSFIPNQAATTQTATNGTQMKPAFCSQIDRRPWACVCGGAAQGPEDAGRDDERHQELHGGDAQVAEPGVQPQRRALLRLGEEEADVRHAGGEVAAAEAAQERQHQHGGVARGRVLHGEADAHRRERGATPWRWPSTSARRRSGTMNE